MKNFKNWIMDVYNTPVKLTGADYERGQNLFILECICGTSIIRLTQGAFIAGFAKMLGIPQGTIGIISAIPTLGNTLQLLGGIYFGNMHKYKLPVSIGSLFTRTILGTIYFIPLLFARTRSQIIFLIILYSLTNFAMSFLNPPIINWIMDLSPESIRGQYFAKREMYTMIIAAVSEVIIAKMLDIFKINGKEKVGFYILGIIVIMWSLVNFYALSSVKEPIRKPKERKSSAKESLMQLFQDTNFKNLAKLYGIWNFSLYIGMLYIAIYTIDGLGMSYLYAMIMSMITLGLRVLSVRLWGNFVEKNSWSKAIEIGAVLMGLSTGLLFLANPTTVKIILPISHILSGIAWGSIGITFFNLQVMFAPEESRTLYIGALSSISGLSGFSATLFAGFFIDMFVNLSINFFGFQISSIQIVFLVSGILLALAGIYVRKVIAPMEERKKNYQ